MPLPTQREQKLVSIMFQILHRVHTEPFFKGKPFSEVAEWAAGQMRDCGFPNQPVGATWAYLSRYDE